MLNEMGSATAFLSRWIFKIFTSVELQTDMLRSAAEPPK